MERTHSLFSQEQDMPIAWFDKNDKEAIKKVIIEHLTNNPTDTLELCKEYSKNDLKRFVGSEIINFYAINPKNGKVSLIVIRGNNEYFKSIEY